MTAVGSKRRGELRMKKLPAPDQVGTGSSFNMDAGIRCEAKQPNQGREREVVWLAFEVRGVALMPVWRGERPRGRSR